MHWLVLIFECGHFHIIIFDLLRMVSVAPQTRGSVDNPSTYGIHVSIECLNATK